MRADIFRQRGDAVLDRLGPLSAQAKHQVLAGGAMGFYGLQ